jgi:hypothetical protein
MPDLLAIGRFAPGAARAALLASWPAGRPARLLAAFTEPLAAAFEDLARAGAGPAELTAALLVLQAVLAAVTHRADLGRPIARRLRPLCGADPRWADLLADDVQATYAQLQCYRPTPALPADLAGVPADLLAALQAAWRSAYEGLPSGLWHALCLAAAAPEPAAAELLVVVPPGPSDDGAEFPADLAAAAPVGAAVLDAWAEGLTLDQTVAAIDGAAPRCVAIAADRPPAAEALAAALPYLRLAAVGPGLDAAWLAARPRFALAAAGPPYADLLALLTAPDGQVLNPAAPGPFPDPRRWPLAAYRRDPTAADVILPVLGRDGARLAADLDRLLRRLPAARARLGPGLSATQAQDLLAALPRPMPSGWWLTLAEPALPAEPLALRRAELAGVLALVGPNAVPPELAAVLGQALNEVGLTLHLAVDVTDLDLPALAQRVNQVQAASPAAVRWVGRARPEAEAVLRP